MSLSDANSWFGIFGGAAGVIATLYVAIDSWKKGRKKRLDESAVVTTNALELVEQLRLQVKDARDEVKDLRGQVHEANQRATDVTDKLQAANRRADDLQDKHDTMAEALTNAQAEVRVLRVQVKHLSNELDKYGGGTTTT